MTNEQLTALFVGLYKQIFLSKAQGTDITKVRVAHSAFTTKDKIINGRWFSKGALRGFDFDFMDGVMLKQHRILEQNPDKTNSSGVLTNYAIAARQGKQIAWIIDRAIQQNGFLGRIENGIWIPWADRGAQIIKPGVIPGTFRREPMPVQQMAVAQAASNQQDLIDLAFLPEMHPEDICEFIEHGEW